MITLTWDETPPKQFKTMKSLLRFIDQYTGIWPCNLRITATEVTYHLNTRDGVPIYAHLGYIATE